MQLRNQLKEVSSAKFSAYCIVAAFGTYFCMYAFRKPFTAATFEDTIWLGIGFKTILVAAQVSGYTISKFVGIKVIGCHGVDGGMDVRWDVLQGRFQSQRDVRFGHR